jgi:hypothetical protein
MGGSLESHAAQHVANCSARWAMLGRDWLAGSITSVSSPSADHVPYDGSLVLSGNVLPVCPVADRRALRSCTPADLTSGLGQAPSEGTETSPREPLHTAQIDAAPEPQIDTSGVRSYQDHRPERRGRLRGRARHRLLPEAEKHGQKAECWSAGGRRCTALFAMH